MVAPDDMDAISEAELISGYTVEPVVALRSDIQSALDRGYDERVSARQTIVDIKIQELEQEMLSNHAEILELEKEKAILMRKREAAEPNRAQ